VAHHSSVVAVSSQTGTDYHFSALGGTTVMLAELVDHVIGVDPDKEWITTAIVELTLSEAFDPLLRGTYVCERTARKCERPLRSDLSPAGLERQRQERPNRW
jgi:hypothetical protein